MWTLELAATVQTTGQTSNPPSVAYIVIAVLAAVAGLVVFVLIRANARHSKR